MTELRLRLQDFALQIANICNLESNGAISSQEAYRRLSTLLNESHFQFDISFICSTLQWDLNHAEFSDAHHATPESEPG